jgi:hypothetical protein
MTMTGPRLYQEATTLYTDGKAVYGPERIAVGQETYWRLEWTNALPPRALYIGALSSFQTDPQGWFDFYRSKAARQTPERDEDAEAVARMAGESLKGD